LSRQRVTIAGAGETGVECAQRLAERDDLDVVLVDSLDDAARGRALDLNDAGALAGFEPRVAGTDSYADAAGSDLCVIAVGRGGSAGMSDDRLLEANAEAVAEAAAGIAEHSPDSVVVVVSEPLDAMCHAALDASGFPRQRVIGMGGVLDTARLRTLLALELGVSVRDVTGLVLGGRGDLMVPLVAQSTVAGVPVERVADAALLEDVAERTRKGGAEVERMLGAPAGYAAAAAVGEMVESIAGDRARVLPCAALCQGEYGIRDVYTGVPCTLGARGIERILEIDLDPADMQALQRAASATREQVAALAKLRAG
jgi:malate dehydrogenase